MSTDDALRALFTAYEGPAAPVAHRTRHSVTPRAVVLLVAAVAICGALVPASRAIVHTFFETPTQFVGDASQPKGARTAIRRFLEQHNWFGHGLTGIEPELTTNTPAGRYGIYGLTFKNGEIGTTIIKLDSGSGGVWAEEKDSCPPGWALRVRGSFVVSPGHTPVFVEGRVSRAVASLDVEREDGRVDHAAIGNGYFLAWITPNPNGGRPSATLIARSASGRQLGAIHVSDGGWIAPSLAERDPSCG